MTQYEKEQFDKLKKQVKKQSQDIEDLNQKLQNQQVTINWMQREMKSGLRDIIERVVRDTIEIDVIHKDENKELADLLQKELKNG